MVIDSETNGKVAEDVGEATAIDDIDPETATATESETQGMVL